MVIVTKSIDENKYYQILYGREICTNNICINAGTLIADEKDIEKLFSLFIRDELHITKGEAFSNVDTEKIIENIKRIM